MLLICNEATFEALTGETGYTIFDIQVTNRFTDDDLAAVRSAAAAATGGKYTFSDRRAQNLEGRGAYLAIAVFFYGFEVCHRPHHGAWHPQLHPDERLGPARAVRRHAGGRAHAAAAAPHGAGRSRRLRRGRVLGRRRARPAAALGAVYQHDYRPLGHGLAGALGRAGRDPCACRRQRAARRLRPGRPPAPAFDYRDDRGENKPCQILLPRYNNSSQR